MSLVKDRMYQRLQLVVFGVIVGSSVGLIEVVFGRGLIEATRLREEYFTILVFFLPIAGLMIEYLFQHFGGSSRQGMTLIFSTAHGDKEKIPLRLIPIVVVSTWLTHLFGGSAGREGVAVQIGSTFSHWMSQKGKRWLDVTLNWPRIAVITGIAAGFSGLFQTPIAAIFFALEVLVVGRIDYRSLLPASVASFIAFSVSKSLHLPGFHFTLTQVPDLESQLIFYLLLIGVIFGLIGRLFTMSLHIGKRWFQRKLPNAYQRIFVGGIAIVIAMVVFHQGRYSGIGAPLIVASLTGDTVYSYDFILKLFLTVLTLSVGFQGGEVTPLFVIGCTLGTVIAPMFGLPYAFVAALGYVGVFGSATNTFLAPIIIGGEVFGFQLLPYFFIVMVAAYSSNGNTSIYSKQLLLDK